MTLGECAAYLRGMERKERDEWERTRMLMYAVVQVSSTKELSPEDVIRFPWDGETQVEEASEEEIRQLRERAKMMEKNG